LLDGNLAKDSVAVYWSDGRVLSNDPAHFVIVSNTENYLFTKETIVGADPTTFRVLNANFECSADQGRAYYQASVITGADPHSFPPGRAVTGCSQTSISFAE
jgi:hypothetical protein